MGEEGFARDNRLDPGGCVLKDSASALNPGFCTWVFIRQALSVFPWAQKMRTPWVQAP